MSEFSKQEHTPLSSVSHELDQPAAELLPKSLVKAMELLQEAHFQNGLAVQVGASGYGGLGHVGESGEKLEFRPGDLGDDEIRREHLIGLGLTQRDLDAGVSFLLGSSITNAKTRHLFISGLFDPDHFRVLRQQPDGKFIDSQLDQIERETILRISFLSQLVGFISARYPEINAYEAVKVFVQDLLASSETLDPDLMESMIYGWALPHVDRRHNMNPTLVCGVYKLDSLVNKFRTDPYDKNNPQHKLIEEGEYFTRVVQTLGEPRSFKSAAELPSADLKSIEEVK
jgi:hypothetical protein